MPIVGCRNTDELFFNIQKTDSCNLNTLFFPLKCKFIFVFVQVLANHEFMISKGCLQPLLILLATQDLVVRQQAAAALRDLSSNLNYKATMAEEGRLIKFIAN